MAGIVRTQRIGPLFARVQQRATQVIDLWMYAMRDPCDQIVPDARALGRREVVAAIADGIQTTRDFAARRDISISNARERFRVARELGWLKLIENETSNVQTRRYTVARQSLALPGMGRVRCLLISKAI